MASTITTTTLVFASLLLSSWLLTVSATGNFYQDVDITWGDQRGQILNNGQLLQLSLDKASGSGFQSKREYLFGKIDMQLKLVPGNSAGTVTAYYVSLPVLPSQFFLLSLILHLCFASLLLTFYYCSFRLKDLLTTKSISNSWETLPENLTFSIPTCSVKAKETGNSSFTSGSIPQKISTPTPSSGIPSALLDGTPIREFKNAESLGFPYPKNQAMSIYSSLWNADDWATRGGLVKTDWTKAPFTASYANFNDNSACVWSSGASSCNSNSPTSTSSPSNAWLTEELDANSQEKLKWVQKNYMIYNYCADTKRFPQGLPSECSMSS